MDKFFGTATLEFGNRKKSVSICINLVENVIEARFPMDTSNALKIFNTGTEWMKSDIRILDIDIKLPYGVITKDVYTDIFIKQYSPGTMSIYDSNLCRALDLRGKEEGITKVILIPRRSKITFDFEYSNSKTSQYELFYSHNRINLGPPISVELDSTPIRIAGDKNGLNLQSQISLSQLEERFRICWSILQGGPLNLRAMLDGKKLTLNLSSDKSIAALGPLYAGEKNLLPMLKVFNLFFQKMKFDEFSHWRRASYFYLEGIGKTTPLEIRTINLLIFLEIIDESRTLDKNTLANQLQIGTDEADILCRARNLLIHQGENLAEALIKAEAELKKYKQITNNIFDIYQNDEFATGALFYFKLASLIGKFWASNIGYTGTLNQYQEFINDIKSRAKSNP